MSTVLVSCFHCGKALLVSKAALQSGQIPYCASCRESQGQPVPPADNPEPKAAIPARAQQVKQRSNARFDPPAKKGSAQKSIESRSEYGPEQSSHVVRTGLIALALFAGIGLGAVVLLSVGVLILILSGQKDAAQDMVTQPGDNQPSSSISRWPDRQVQLPVPAAPDFAVKQEPEPAPIAIPEQLTITASLTAVPGLAFSPEGDILVTASGHLGVPGLLRFWNTTTGNASPLQVAPGSDLFGVACRSDGSLLASASGDKGVQIYGAKGQLVGGFQHPSYVRAVAFAPHDRLLASSCERQLKVWDMTTQRELWNKGLLGELRPWRVPLRISFSPDGKTVAFGNGSRNLLLCDALTGQVEYEGKGHTGPILCSAYSPDGKYVASGSFDQTIRIWDPAKGQFLKLLEGHHGCVSCVAFARDSRTLASAGREGAVILWDVSSGRKLAALEAHKKEACCVLFSPSGNTLASSGVDGKVRLWDVTGVVGKP
jgi:WD domain, G-beta repeat